MVGDRVLEHGSSLVDVELEELRVGLDTAFTRLIEVECVSVVS